MTAFQVFLVKSRFLPENRPRYWVASDGKYDVVRGSDDLGTLAQVPFNINDFDGAALTANGDKYLVVLTGGKLKAAVDHLEVVVNPSNWTIETMVGYGFQGEKVFDGKIGYFADLTQGMNEMDYTIDTGLKKTTTKLEVLTSEPNAPIAVDSFSVVQK